MTVYTYHTGDNASLIKAVSDLYVQDGDEVADVTYGKGAFWKRTDTDRFTLHKTDLRTTKPRCDFRRLKYEDNSMAHVILDPPYMHNAGKPMVESRYRNAETTKGMYHRDIMKLYREGMIEAKRVLMVEGKLWVKCQDEIESGYQRWSHIELYEYARRMGFYAKDLFVLGREKAPVQRKQKHARKTHSYLWIFENPSTKTAKYLAANEL